MAGFFVVRLPRRTVVPRHVGDRLARVGLLASPAVLDRRQLPRLRQAAGTVGWAIGLFFGSVFLAWLVGAARGSVLVVALWHTAYNFATATEASAGSVAALATVAVVLATVWIMRAGGGAPPTSAPRG